MVQGCNKHVSIPVMSRIKDKKVVLVYNVCFWLTAAVALFIFIVLQKQWALSTPLSISANMWLGNYEPSPNAPKPVYCDNPEYDYVYSADFRYVNNSCVELDADEIFFKGRGMPGAFWLSTLTKNMLSKLKHAECNHTDITKCSLKKEKIGDPQTTFVKNLEKYTLNFQMGVESPYLNYDSRITPTNVYYTRPHSTERIKLAGFSRKSLLSISVKDWLELFDVDLDKTSQELNDVYSIDESIGNARIRQTGVNLVVEVQVSNVWESWSLPYNIFIVLRLKVEKNWQRSLYRPEPANPGYIHVAEDYGIRIVFEFLPSEVLVFSFEEALIALLDIFIFFRIMKIITSYAFLHCFGPESTKWRRLINQNVVQFSYLQEEVVLDKHGKKKSTKESTRDKKVTAKKVHNRRPANMSSPAKSIQASRGSSSPVARQSSRQKKESRTRHEAGSARV